MHYGSTTKATAFRPADWRVKLTRAVLFFIPSANPDVEHLFPDIKKWMLEVDDDGSPMREIAIDAAGNVLFRTPNGKNFGFWTDSDAEFAASDLEPISPEEFNRLWNAAKPY